MTKRRQKLETILRRLDDLGEGDATVLFGSVVWRLYDRRNDSGVEQVYQIEAKTYPYSRAVAALMGR